MSIPLSNSFFLEPQILSRKARATATPILPSQYIEDIAQGFATNYFKTETPGEKYRDKNIQDVYDKGFRNLRLRCRADLYDAPYSAEETKFKAFLDKLEEVKTRGGARSENDHKSGPKFGFRNRTLTVQ